MIQRVRTVAARFCISRATLYRMIKSGRIAAPKQISPGIVGWEEEYIDAWLASRPRAGTPAGTHAENIAAESA